MTGRDLKLFDRINKEVIGDLGSGKPGWINQTAILYKISAKDTAVDMYGESSDGKTYKVGIEFACLINHDDFDWSSEAFGPDENQNATFHILRDAMVQAAIVPQVGDIFEWNYAYFEINGINENQLIYGKYDNNWSASYICHRIRKSNLNIERVRSQ